MHVYLGFGTKASAMDPFQGRGRPYCHGERKGGHTLFHWGLWDDEEDKDSYAEICGKAQDGHSFTVACGAGRKINIVAPISKG